MLADKKLSFQEELEEYLEYQKVYDIFEDMMKNLIISQPKNPIEFLVNKLSSPESNTFSLTCFSQAVHNRWASWLQAKRNRLVPCGVHVGERAAGLHLCRRFAQQGNIQEV